MHSQFLNDYYSNLITLRHQKIPVRCSKFWQFNKLFVQENYAKSFFNILAGP